MKDILHEYEARSLPMQACIHAGVLYLLVYIVALFPACAVKLMSFPACAVKLLKLPRITAHAGDGRKRFFFVSVQKCRKRVFFVSGNIAPAANGNGGSVTVHRNSIFTNRNSVCFCEP